jgi:hypothetical protein
MVFFLAIIILLLLHKEAYGQNVYGEVELPVLIQKGDTVQFTEEAWAEKVDTEIKQRHTIHIQQKKLDRLHSILHHKKGLEFQMDSLITLSDSLSVTIDSLSSKLAVVMQKDRKSLISKLTAISKRLQNTREQYFTIRRKFRRAKFQRTLLLTIIIVETGVLLVCFI